MVRYLLRLRVYVKKRKKESHVVVTWPCLFVGHVVVTWLVFIFRKGLLFTLVSCLTVRYCLGFFLFC